MKITSIILVVFFLISMFSITLAADPMFPSLPPLESLYSGKQLDAIKEGLTTKTEIKELKKSGMNNAEIDEKFYPTKVYPAPAAYEAPKPTFKEEMFTYFPLMMGIILGACIGYFVRLKAEK